MVFSPTTSNRPTEILPFVQDIQNSEYALLFNTVPLWGLRQWPWRINLIQDLLLLHPPNTISYNGSLRFCVLISATWASLLALTLNDQLDLSAAVKQCLLNSTYFSSSRVAISMLPAVEQKTKHNQDKTETKRISLNIFFLSFICNLYV